MPKVELIENGLKSRTYRVQAESEYGAYDVLEKYFRTDEPNFPYRSPVNGRHSMDLRRMGGHIYKLGNIKRPTVGTYLVTMKKSTFDEDDLRQAGLTRKDLTLKARDAYYAAAYGWDKKNLGSLADNVTPLGEMKGVYTFEVQADSSAEAVQAVESYIEYEMYKVVRYAEGGGDFSDSLDSCEGGRYFVVGSITKYQGGVYVVKAGESVVEWEDARDQGISRRAYDKLVEEWEDEAGMSGVGYTLKKLLAKLRASIRGSHTTTNGAKRTVRRNRRNVNAAGKKLINRFHSISSTSSTPTRMATAKKPAKATTTRTATKRRRSTSDPIKKTGVLYPYKKVALRAAWEAKGYGIDKQVSAAARRLHAGTATAEDAGWLRRQSVADKKSRMRRGSLAGTPKKRTTTKKVGAAKRNPNWKPTAAQTRALSPALIKGLRKYHTGK